MDYWFCFLDRGLGQGNEEMMYFVFTTTTTTIQISSSSSSSTKHATVRLSQSGRGNNKHKTALGNRGETRSPWHHLPFSCCAPGARYQVSAKKNNTKLNKIVIKQNKATYLETKKNPRKTTKGKTSTQQNKHTVPYPPPRSNSKYNRTIELNTSYRLCGRWPSTQAAGSATE